MTLSCRRPTPPPPWAPLSLLCLCTDSSLLLEKYPAISLCLQKSLQRRRGLLCEGIAPAAGLQTEAMARTAQGLGFVVLFCFVFLLLFKNSQNTGNPYLQRDQKGRENCSCQLLATLWFDCSVASSCWNGELVTLRVSPLLLACRGGVTSCLRGSGRLRESRVLGEQSCGIFLFT